MSTKPATTPSSIRPRLLPRALTTAAALLALIASASLPPAATDAAAAASTPQITVHASRLYAGHLQRWTTLQGLSQRFYGTGAYWPLIRDANRLPRDCGPRMRLWKLGGRWKVGAALKIPALPAGTRIRAALRDRIVIRDAQSPAVRCYLAELDRLSPALMSRFKTLGGQVIVAAAPPARFPELGGQLGGEPAGYPPGATWDDVPALAAVPAIYLGVPAGASDRTWLSDGLALHEVGHVLGKSTQPLDTDPAWLAIHAARYPSLAPYYQLGGPGSVAGAGEMFAGCFSDLERWGRAIAVRDFGQDAVAWMSQRLGLA